MKKTTVTVIGLLFIGVVNANDTCSAARESADGMIEAYRTMLLKSDMRLITCLIRPDAIAEAREVLVNVIEAATKAGRKDDLKEFAQMFQITKIEDFEALSADETLSRLWVSMNGLKGKTTAKQVNIYSRKKVSERHETMQVEVEIDGGSQISKLDVYRDYGGWYMGFEEGVSMEPVIDQMISGFRIMEERYIEMIQQ